MSKPVLIVDDEQMIRWMLSQTLNSWGYSTVEAENFETAIQLSDRIEPLLTLLDINLPDGSGLELLRKIKQKDPTASVVMITANALVENTIAALRRGACDFITKPINLAELKSVIENCLPAENNAAKNAFQIKTDSEKSLSGFDKIIGTSTQIREVIALARKVSKSNVSCVLLQGESGTGKDLIASAIHYASPRAEYPLVTINCAALPANLIESELFGYEKGSFTDAKHTKEGLFEQARGGTIFLDEIGEMELSLQAKLLRVLEAGVFRRIGGLRDLPLNASIIAASNRNLREAGKVGTFRQDLYFRLAIIEIDVPPLRERGEDVILLANHFIKTLGRASRRRENRRLATETIEAFRHYHWVGNVRELRNAIERAIILEDDEQITLKYMPPILSTNNASAKFFRRSTDFKIQLPPTGISLEEVENSLIQQALERSHGNVTKAAEYLKITRDQMRYHLKKLKAER